MAFVDVLFDEILHVGNQEVWIFDNRIISFQVAGAMEKIYTVG